MSQYTISSSQKQFKILQKQDVDNIKIINGYSVCFYDGSNIVFKDKDGNYNSYQQNDSVLILKRPLVDDPLFLKIYVSQTGSSNDKVLVVDTSTEVGRSKCRAYITGINGIASWNELSANGLTSEYADAPVKIDLSGIQNIPGYVFYRWETSEGSDREFDSMYFPNSSEMAKQQFNQDNLEVEVVDELPENADQNVLYLIPEEDNNG